MRNEPNLRIEQHRVKHPNLPDSPPGVNWGYFRVGSLRIISSGTPEQGELGWPWEHVSVSCESRCPTWEEMARVKELFWRDDETVVQFHPPKSEYVNHHPFCLHLWRNTGVEVILPPKNLIA